MSPAHACMPWVSSPLARPLQSRRPRLAAFSRRLASTARPLHSSRSGSSSEIRALSALST
eukprot:1222367-Prymnesium_polylepis.1